VKIDTTFLRSKVAKRIFALFISCAIIPIIVLAIPSLFQVAKNFDRQSKHWLGERTRAMRSGVQELLLIVNNELGSAATSVTLNPHDLLPSISQGFISRLEKYFKGAIIITETGKKIPFFGEVKNCPELTPKEREEILSGKLFLSTEHAPGSSAQIFMAVAGGSENLKNGIVLAEIDIKSLLSFGLVEIPVYYGIKVCLLDDDKNFIYSDFNPPPSFPERIMLLMEGNQLEGAERKEATAEEFEWSYMKEKYLWSYRSIFLEGNFLIRNSKNWWLFLGQLKKDIPEILLLSDFKKIFILGVLLALWVVLLLSYNQIRRTLVPLERLKEGTKRIARKEFSSRVIVKSRDEFGEVAESFNSMASQLGRHFKTLTTVAEIDRAVLSVLDREKIVDTVLDRMREVFPCNGVGVTVLDSISKDKAQIYVRDSGLEHERLMDTVELKSQDVQSLYNNPKTLMLEAGDVWPSYLLPLARRGNKSFLILPIFIKKELSGIVTLGYHQPPSLTQDDLEQARQLADLVAVAFSNVRLIEELDRLNWGTLRALARAIDAKSPWTAGHSERMTKLALQIGEKMGLSQEEIDDLHRGGLLHDIGKIGISPEILDKPGKLTDEERQMMNRHAASGARILEPIVAYAKVIPLVLQHHERFNGQGYPDGLVGEAISLGARIFGVADTFEALTSDRPYRKALQHKRAAQYIKKRAGIEFDPIVVQAFLEFMAEEEGIKV
jgi:putative nucleotidyltransferase with HDIG domain